MTFKVSGFAGEQAEQSAMIPAAGESTSVPKKSVVQIKFPGYGQLAYYNDRFDLHTGDRVYVDGKLEGQMGVVTAVNYSFKIRLSEYKRVIALVDTCVHGQFCMAGSHFITFDANTLPAEQVLTWFRAPDGEEEIYEQGSDDTAFCLDDLQQMGVTSAIAERGRQYYMENRVRYLCLRGTKGFAIVEGTKSYTVEFRYADGEIRGLVCDCFCSYACKHGFAAMLQLRETLGLIEKYYAKTYAETGYFAAIDKGTLFRFAVEGKESGSFTL